MAANTITPASAPSPWITRPWVDLLVGCGGWSLPLLLISYTLVDRDVPRWSAAFYALAIVFNYPHYMATIYRAYGRDDRGQYRLYTHYLTAALVLVALAAHLQFALVPWLFTAYVMWSPWHYTGQNFGLLMMFLRRAGLEVSPEERRRLRMAFVASYVMLLAAFNFGASRDPLVLSLGLPALPTLIIEAGAALVFLVAGVSAFVPLWRRAHRPALIAPLTLYSTQALWFVIPIALTWVSRVAVPQTRYSSGMLAIMHSAQYLWVTRYFAKKDAERASSPATWRASAYWATLVIGGLALFVPVPWLASLGGHVDFTVSVFIVAATVNIHHFMIDGVVWKLRHPRVGQVLVGGQAAAQAGAPTAAAMAPAVAPRPARKVGHFVWQGAAAAALVALAGVDQWHYLLAVGDGNRPKLEAAMAMNPYDSGALVRLAQTAKASGDVAGAESALQRAIAASPGNPAPAQALERLLISEKRYADAYTVCQVILNHWPRDLDTLVNAGVLAYHLKDAAAAERWWSAAVKLKPSLRSVHLYLAELLDGESRTNDALAHYQAYLELVLQAPVGDRPSPREVSTVLVKFADALVRHGNREAAQKQYEFAARLARQNGLPDVERLASTGRAAIR